MSFERIIVNKLNEARRLQVTSENLNESWPPILNKLPNYEKNVVRKELIKYGIDIENTATKPTKITTGRDPRLKGKNLCVFLLKHSGIAVWFNGETLVNPYIGDKPFSRTSWKDILDEAYEIYVMEFDEEISKAMKDKQKARADAKAGSVQRYTDVRKRPRGLQIDKSGYAFNPNKYRNMLADMKLSQGEDVLKRAKDVYVKLANSIDKIDFVNDRDYYNYEYVVRGLVRIFQDYPRYLDEYKKDKYKDSEFSYTKSQVLESIKELDKLCAIAKKYI